MQRSSSIKNALELGAIIGDGQCLSPLFVLFSAHPIFTNITLCTFSHFQINYDFFYYRGTKMLWNVTFQNILHTNRMFQTVPRTTAGPGRA